VASQVVTVPRGLLAKGRTLRGILAAGRCQEGVNILDKFDLTTYDAYAGRWILDDK
jgi:hypothetical protein